MLLVRSAMTQTLKMTLQAAKQPTASKIVPLRVLQDMDVKNAKLVLSFMSQASKTTITNMAVELPLTVLSGS
jgi:hypothetical protein